MGRNSGESLFIEQTTKGETGMEKVPGSSQVTGQRWGVYPISVFFYLFLLYLKNRV